MVKYWGDTEQTELHAGFILGEPEYREIQWLRITKKPQKPKTN